MASDIFAAVKDARRDRLVTVLNELIQRCGAAVPIIEELLLTKNFDSSEASDAGDDNKEEREPHTRQAKGTKRKRAMTQTTEVSQKRKLYEICIQCSEEYNVRENDKESCIFHPGKRVADRESDVWDDHDEDCHGNISDLEDEFPEGFLWLCCNEDGTHRGCQIGRHRYI